MENLKQTFITVSPVTLIAQIFNLAATAGLIYLIVLLLRACRKYVKSVEVRKETQAVRQTLSEVLKAHRIQCKMTQEFVAEHLGVSRQAVSKWESGVSDPSTANLLALAKLYGISAEELLKEATQ